MTVLHHPKNKAERRRINKKKVVLKHERDEAVDRRLAKEQLEQKEALDVLRHEVSGSEEI